ncbi:MAG: type I-C CRISPR-associated protein Cas8c/Csd1 [Lachnospiraceae bacterium]|nr:type I-C CRISPR-associated protein Cas8c/Csd1 [Lachnospiraceae bacterium]
MALYNDLIQLYDNAKGHEPEGLGHIAPIAHQYGSKKQVVDVTITEDGRYAGSEINDKAEGLTLLAVTEESAGRTSSAATTPHALNDNLYFMCRNNYAGKDGINKSYKAYIEQLGKWCASDYGCVQAKAVLRYISDNDLLDDMKKDGKFATIDDDKELKKYLDDLKKYTVRWRVVSDDPEQISETWKNPDTIDSWTRYYTDYHNKHAPVHEIDFITGKESDIELNHPKPVNLYANAKIISISTKEDIVTNFKGERFSNENGLPQIGYVASQKMHNALSWLVNTQRITYCGRVLVCFSPDAVSDIGDCGFQLSTLFGVSGLDNNDDYESYLQRFKNLVYKGIDKGLVGKHVVIFMLDSSSKGRFAPIMYKSFDADSYVRRISDWYKNCSWYRKDMETGNYLMKPVSLSEIVRAAYGTLRDNYLDVRDEIRKEEIDTLLGVVLNGTPIPESMIYHLAEQVSPERFKTDTGDIFNRIIIAACAVLHWKHTREKKGERDMALDRENTDRSYVYGRLLAVYDRIENAALNKKGTKNEKGYTEHRDTNAMRMWTAYAAHPKMTLMSLQERVQPYLSSLPYGLRTYFQNEITSIMELMPADTGRDYKLSPEYIMGFYHERAEFAKKTTDDKED